ncbi:MAG: aspartate dehydrogenase, partial [Methanobacteriaceae archaeon]|nr:aspartate dehydrogenase [Methanobacteriaceae archaeon]
MIVGIVGCGAIANIITNYALEGKLGVDLKYFYDRDVERAENLASQLEGTAVLKIEDMLEHVDMVIEAAAPMAVAEVVPKIIKKGKNVIIMSIGALMDEDVKKNLENLATENNVKIYAPSGAIVGLDGIKAASIGTIRKATLTTRKPPKSLGIEISEKKTLYKGRASEAVKKFPVNINVAAALSIACEMDVEVEIIADPEVDRNVHEVLVEGDFGEFRTTTKNVRCA